MKVLHVESGRNLYGGALQVKYLVEALAERGVENVLACPRGSAVAEAVAEGDHITVAPMAMKGDLDVGMVTRLRRLIRAERPDLVHLHSRRGADLFGGLAARLGGVPALLTRRVDNPEPAAWVGVKYRLYHHVVAISEGIRRVLLSEGLAPERVTTVHSAVDTELFRPECDATWFRRPLGIPASAPVIGMVAQLIERKGHTYVLEALPAILERFPEARLVLFGKGPLEAELKRLAEPFGRRVIFAGFRSDIHRHLPCLDLLLHPADMEGLGVALLQASACGVPVVATPAGGIPEIVHSGENGYLVPPGNAAALAAKSIELLEAPEQRRALGRAGRALVERAFSIDAMAEGNLAVYRRLVER